MTDFGSLETEPKRDGYGRYLITPPDGGKAVPMTRATTVAKALDDTEGLQKWMKRQVAFGMAQRPDLVAAAATTDATDKKRLASIAEDAMSAAGSSAAATVGTALHRATELADLGLEVPEMFAERVGEYERALKAAGITVDPELVEAVLVLWQHQIAGTTDRIVTVGGRRYVFDLKTGEAIYPHSFAVQCYLYAAADHRFSPAIAAEWDDYRSALVAAILSVKDHGGDVEGEWATHLADVPRAYSKANEWTCEQMERIGSVFMPMYPAPTERPLRPMPEVDQDRAIICHLPAKGGPCTLHWLDISAGREALEHALWVRTWRKRRDLLTPFDVPEVPNAEPPALEVVRDELQPRRERLLAALRPLKDADATTFVATWRRALADVAFPNKADEWDAAAMDAVERAYELAWTDDVVPTVAPETTMPEPRPETEAEDHGGLIDPDSLAEAREQIKHLPRGAKGWMMAWQDDAVANGLAWRMGRGPHVSVRSWWTTKAGYWLARLVHNSDADDPQDDARLVLASVLGDAALMPTISVGQCLSSLTVDEASLCCSLAQCAVEGDVRINDQGLLEVAA
jgi:hypothetical protein